MLKTEEKTGYWVEHFSPSAPDGFVVEATADEPGAFYSTMRRDGYPHHRRERVAVETRDAFTGAVVTKCEDVWTTEYCYGDWY